MVIESTAAPLVIEAQFHSFAKRMPAYYASVVTMMVSVAYVLHSLAPWWLSCGIPALASALGVWRGLWWIRHRNDRPGAVQAKAHLRRATRTLVSAAIVVTLMDAMLFRYGNVHTRYFLLMQMMASAMCGFYCLMHLRTAALTVFAAVMVPFCLLAFSMHIVIATVAALTCVLTAFVMIGAMRGYEQDFVSLVEVKAQALALSEENLRLAHLDMLTGLPNRRRFFEILSTLHAVEEDSWFSPAVGIIDLDGFKPVNDTYGHLVGDKVLAEIAARLRTLSGEIRHLCRLGGDEFAFVFDATHPETLLCLGERIIATVSRSLRIDERIISVGCSVGCAITNEGREINGFALFEQADYALYHAKRSGRARAVLFSEEHETLLREQGLIEQALRNADLDAEFFPLFQPIVEARTQHIVGFESLARWSNPVLGPVSPGIFIPLAESTGLISELTLVLLKKSLAAASTWPAHVHLSFNISPNDIASAEKTRAILAVLKASGVAPQRIAIELTETALLRSFEETRMHMDWIRAFGSSIHLDDFGTGHSSLSYVHSLPLDRIKVDRSFILDLESNPASRNLARSIVTLCRDLGLQSVVEGVETQGQLDCLHDMGAELLQGFLFSRPVKPELINALLGRYGAAHQSATQL